MPSRPPSPGYSLFDVQRTFGTACVHAMVVHGGAREVMEVEEDVRLAMLDLAPAPWLATQQSHHWTPEGFPRPISAHGWFLRDPDGAGNLQHAQRLANDLRTGLRNRFVEEHPGGSLIVLCRFASVINDAAMLSLCHPKNESKGTWVDEPMSAKYLPDPVCAGVGWGTGWFTTETMEAVLNTYIERRLDSHWGPLLAPLRQQLLEEQLSPSSPGNRPRL